MIILWAFTCTSFFLKSFNLSATERPAYSKGWITTGLISWGGWLFQTSSTKFVEVWTNFCCFLTKVRSHFCAVSIDTHQGSIPMAECSGRFWQPNHEIHLIRQEELVKKTNKNVQSCSLGNLMIGLIRSSSELVTHICHPHIYSRVFPNSHKLLLFTKLLCCLQKVTTICPKPCFILRYKRQTWAKFKTQFSIHIQIAVIS